jgi:hypothetical protein
MTYDTYREDDENEEKKEKKDEKKDEKKSMAFKATSSSKGKAKQDTSSEDDDSSFDDMDDEKMALFVKRFGKFMVKKAIVQGGRSHDPRARIKQEDASSVVARIILLLNTHRIATMTMMIRRARRKTRRRTR